MLGSCQVQANPTCTGSGCRHLRDLAMMIGPATSINAVSSERETGSSGLDWLVGVFR